MKFQPVPVFSMAMIGVGLFFWSSEKRQKMPQLRVSESIVCLGQAEPGEKLSTDLQVRNVGDSPLQILDLGKSCGCTAVDCSPRIIPPDSCGILTIKMVKGSRDRTEATVSIRSNDPAQPVVSIGVYAERKSTYRVYPKEIVAKRLADEKHRPATVTIELSRPIPVDMRTELSVASESKFVVPTWELDESAFAIKIHAAEPTEDWSGTVRDVIFVNVPTLSEPIQIAVKMQRDSMFVPANGQLIHVGADSPTIDLPLATSISLAHSVPKPHQSIQWSLEPGRLTFATGAVANGKNVIRQCFPVPLTDGVHDEVFYVSLAWVNSNIAPAKQ